MINRKSILSAYNYQGYQLSLFIISAIAFKDFILFFIKREYLFGENAIIPLSIYHQNLIDYNVEYLKLPFGSSLFTTLFLLLVIISISGLLLRKWIVLSGAIVYFGYLQLFMRNVEILDGGDNVILVMLPWLVLSNFFYSRKKTRLNYIPSYIIHLLQSFSKITLVFQFISIYFFASVEKLFFHTWTDGTALYYILNTEDFSIGSMSVFIAGSPVLISILTYGTLVWEFSFVFLIWFKKTKIPMLILSLICHLGILILMRIDNFSFIMISMYPVLLTDTELTDIRKLLNNKVLSLFLVLKKTISFNFS